MPLIITKFGNYLRHAFVSRLAFAFWRIFRGNHMQLVFFYQHKRMYNQLCKGGNVNCTASAQSALNHALLRVAMIINLCVLSTTTTRVARDLPPQIATCIHKNTNTQTRGTSDIYIIIFNYRLH